MTDDDVIDDLARVLFEEMNNLDPLEQDNWIDLTEGEKNIYRLAL
jgi:hypothetical protein